MVFQANRLAPVVADVRDRYEQLQPLHLVASRALTPWPTAVGTAVVAVLISLGALELTALKFKMVDALVAQEKNGTLAKGLALVAFAGVSGGLAFFASLPVSFLCPRAAGSGISEIKCMLNGVKIPHVVRITTLLGKVFGIILSVASGLPVGKEGPMIHRYRACALAAHRVRPCAHQYSTVPTHAQRCNSWRWVVTGQVTNPGLGAEGAGVSQRLGEAGRVGVWCLRWRRRRVRSTHWRGAVCVGGRGIALVRDASDGGTSCFAAHVGARMVPHWCGHCTGFKA